MARADRARLRSLPTRDPAFIEPMECLAVAKLPEGAQWVWEIKLDGTAAPRKCCIPRIGCTEYR